MSSGADLFVVCKQCGSEVSPYITECPYCGSRLRRRAPKLPRAGSPRRQPRRARLAALLTRPAARRRTAVATEHRVRRSDRWAYTRPYATITLVLLSCASWVLAHAEGAAYPKMEIEGPLHGEWWRLITSAFAYNRGVAAFITITTIAIFGWLLERRHGPAIVLMVFLGASVTGALVALAVYEVAVVTTANSGALALLSAWAVPDLMAARSRSYYDGDLLGAAVIAALLLVLPFAYTSSEISWLAGVVGAAFGLLVGLGLQLREPALPG
jgi:membrane associated rhomboid family serine protease